MRSIFVRSSGEFGARLIESMRLNQAAATLEHVLAFSVSYFERLAAVLYPSAVCNQVLREDNVDSLRVGVPEAIASARGSRVRKGFGYGRCLR